MAGSARRDEVILVGELAAQGRPHLDEGFRDRPVRLGQVVPDRRVKLGQPVVGHHREHVVFDMVVHVPVNEPAHRVHVDGARVQPMVGDVVGQPAMLERGPS